MTARLQVRVQPGACRNGVAGVLADGTVRLRVTAAPEAGRANRAVVELLAEVLDVARSDVTIVRGAGSRSKVVEIAGLTEDLVRARLGGRTDTERHDGE